MDQSSSSLRTERILALLSTFIIILVPTVGINRILGYYRVLESSYFWPWLILIRYQPNNAAFATDMYHFVLPPWSLFVHLPFLFALRYLYDQFNSYGKKERNAGLIAILSLVQMFIIWVAYQSQEPDIMENYRLIFLPELLLLFIQGYFGVKWYMEKTRSALEKSKQRRMAEENELMEDVSDNESKVNEN